MDDEAIRELLASAPRSAELPRPPGTVAILREHVERSGADVQAVEAWIGRRAGEARIAPSIHSRPAQASGASARWEGPFPYYVIPAPALDAGQTERKIR